MIFFSYLQTSGVSYSCVGEVPLNVVYAQDGVSIQRTVYILEKWGVNVLARTRKHRSAMHSLKRSVSLAAGKELRVLAAWKEVRHCPGASTSCIVMTWTGWKLATFSLLPFGTYGWKQLLGTEYRRLFIGWSQDVFFRWVTRTDSLGLVQCKCFPTWKDVKNTSMGR